MTHKETKLRIKPELDSWLNTQAAIAGVAKTKYIIQVLEDLRSNAGSTHPKLSPKISPESPVETNIYDEVAAIKARLTKLEQGSPNDSPDEPQFYEGQEITGQSAKTYRLLWNSFEAEQKINRSTFYLSNKLGVICKVIGSSKAGKKKLSIWSTFPGDRLVIRDDGTFLEERSSGKLGWAFEEVEPTSPVEPTNEQTPIEVVSQPLEEPTSAVELSSDEIEVEDVTEAHAAQHEPLEEVAITPQSGDSTATEIVLSRDQLVQRLAKTPGEAKTFGATLTTVGGEQMKASNILNWTSQQDPEGKCWLPTDATREYWVEQLSSVG